MATHNMSADALAAIDLDAIDRAQRQHERRGRWTAFLFMSPSLILVSGLLLYPVAFNIWVSFTQWRRFRNFGEWAGIAQYERLWANPNFELALYNTFFWVFVSLVLPVVLGLAIAIMIRGQRFEETAKSIFFIPRLLAPTAIGVLWYYVYAPDGMLNAVLGGISGSEVDIGWLYDDATVTGSVMVAYLWQTVGFAMVLLLLGLSAVPKDPIEAASVEGASGWQTFQHVILPLLLPTILVVVILSVLAGFTVFDHLWVMAKDYPAKRTLSLTVYMYVEAFEKSSWAYASAIAVVLGLVVLSVTWLQIILQERIERLTK